MGIFLIKKSFVTKLLQKCNINVIFEQKMAAKLQTSELQEFDKDLPILTSTPFCDIITPDDRSR